MQQTLQRLPAKYELVRESCQGINARFSAIAAKRGVTLQMINCGDRAFDGTWDTLQVALDKIYANLAVLEVLT
jgi:hypothetical protein